MGVEGDAGEDRRKGWGEEGRGAMRGQGCGEGAGERGGMREEQSGGRRDEGRRRRGGTSLRRRRRRDNGTLPTPEPQAEPGARGQRGGGGGGRAADRYRARLLSSSRSRRLRGGNPTPLTLSDHRLEADGGHRAARVSGLLASSRDARGHRRLPGSSERSAGCRPPPLQPRLEND